MKNVMKKVAVSSMLAVSLGAVSLLSPLATGQVMAKSNSDQIKDQAEEQLIIKQQEEAQKAFEAKLLELKLLKMQQLQHQLNQLLRTIIKQQPQNQQRLQLKHQQL